MNFGIFSKLGEKNKMPLNSLTNGSKDILYLLYRRFFKKKGSKNKLFISIDFFYSFRELRTTNFGIFSKLGEKIKMYLKGHLNASKETLQVLDRRFF